MSLNKKNIPASVLLVIILAGLIYLVFLVKEREEKNNIKMIKVKFAHLLTPEEYIRHTGLSEITDSDKISLGYIKKKFDEHPYVEKADVLFSSREEVEVRVKEKVISAYLHRGFDRFLITDEFEVLPVFSEGNYNLPEILNCREENIVETGKKFFNEDIITAFRIIEAVKFTNEEMYQKLREINLNYGGDIIIKFDGFKSPVIFGKGNEAKKMIYLEILWKGSPKTKNILNQSEAVDLRFSNDIYIKKDLTTGLTE
ncbi:MAG: hypothetical protein Kow0098_14000 [Ignavibacteriaceae bacterium]